MLLEGMEQILDDDDNEEEEEGKQGSIHKTDWEITVQMCYVCWVYPLVLLYDMSLSKVHF